MTKVIIGDGVRVEVYYNRHLRCLSYRARGGKVAHAQAMILNNVKFVVQPAGNAKVRLWGRRNVHAYVRGEISWQTDDMVHGMEDYDEENMRRQGYRQITYNPYYNSYFVYRDTQEPIKSASQVVIVGKNIYLSGRDTTNA